VGAPRLIEPHMYVATLTAVVASTTLTIGLYFMKREAQRLPSLSGWQPRAWWAFVSDPWWVLGVALQTAGYGLYLGALRDAPLSIVHTALNAGIAFFMVLAVIGLGERPRPLEWLGVAGVVLGLIVLGLSLSADTPDGGGAAGTDVFATALVALALVALLIDPAPGRPIGVSVASGLLLGLAGVFAKSLASAASLAAAVLGTDLLLTLGANIAGFALMQVALQAGRGVVVVPIFATLSNLVPIIGGIVVYGERLPDHGAAAVLRPLSIVLALGGAAVLASCGEREAVGRAQVEDASSR